MLVITEPGAHGLKAVLNTPRAAVQPNPDNTFALDHDWYEEDIRLQADGSYTIDESVVAQLAAEASKLLKGEPLRAASWKLGLKPIPGDGEPVFGELESVPGCFVAFTHSGADCERTTGGRDSHRREAADAGELPARTLRIKKAGRDGRLFFTLTYPR